MSTTASGTRLCDLPDDLLQRILHLLPGSEAASTAVLSRRWHSLLPTLTPAVVHLNTRSYHQLQADSDSWCHAFLQDAREALATHGSGVKRLSISICNDEEEHGRGILNLLSYSDHRNIMDDVLSHPACHGVEQLRIDAYYPRFRAAGRRHRAPNDVPHGSNVIYSLRCDSIPSTALRDLHITDCCDLKPHAPATGFPCLAVLRLQSCVVSLNRIQEMIMASPNLHTLHLDYVFITMEDNEDTMPEVQQRFRCPAVTTLFLDNCNIDDDHDWAVEFDAPGVRHFRFAGHIDMFSLRSPLPELARVDLHVFDPNYGHPLERPMRELFWNILKAFCSTKVLKLKLMCPVEDIAVADEELLVHEVLCSNLEHLELDVKHMPASQDAAVAIGNLIRCCSAVTDLTIKLNIVDDHPYPRMNELHMNPCEYPAALLNRKAKHDFRKSIDHFKRRRDPTVISVGGDDNDNCNSEVSDILGLMRDRWLNINCLQFSLKRVSLKYSVGNDICSCFAAQLAKFFSEAAMVLEEMCIDDGNRKMCEHVNCKFAGRTTNPIHASCSEYKISGAISHEGGVKKKLCTSRVGETLPSNSTHQVKSRGFTILPLERYEDDLR